MRILLIEDMADHRELMSLSLARHDPAWRVDAAASWETALDRLSGEGTYDLVFLDYSLPQKNGVEVLNKIRQWEDPPPVVMVTGRGDEQVAVEAMKAGAYDYVVKEPGYLQRLPVVAQRAVEAHQLALDHRQAQRQLQVSEERYRVSVESAPYGIMVHDLDGKVLVFNPELERITGYSRNEIPDVQSWIEKAYPEEERSECYDQGISVPDLDRHPRLQEATIARKDGEERTCQFVFSSLPTSVRTIFVNDITERKRAEGEREKLQAQLLQTQKVQAIGRLAGGVAHDFNNLLTAITGYGELLISKLPSGDPRHMDAQEILKAAEKGALLTHQLLAFSRQQMLQPQVLDLNALIANTERMLRRLIGEDIELVTVPDPTLSRIRADPGQIAQVVMNLAVNARDAMPQGGRITIETENVLLDTDECASVPEARSGRFVCMSVADTGTGISEETLQHIYEPFFTTKESGTGLGLSVVYGIVQQHEGWIDVRSTPSQGSSFRVFLPAFSVAAEGEITEALPLQALQGGTEGILVVEDEEGVRRLVAGVLEERGYVVFEAANVSEAIAAFERDQAKISLLFSDVVLPDGTGLQVADQLLSRKDDLKVLLGSGYTDDKARWSSIQASKLPFIQKPYNVRRLLQSIRQAIDAT